MSLHLRVVCVGKPGGWAAEAADDYLSRVRRYTPSELCVVRPERDADRDPAVARRREGERLYEALPKGAVVVALDPLGKSMDSPAFSQFINKQQNAGIRDLAFLIGGPVGLSDEARSGARMLLSLSPLTLPHELALVVLSEQLYRAFTILRGERYHK